MNTKYTSFNMQRGGGYSEMPLGGVAPFMERNHDMVSTLESRREVLQSQQATQTIPGSSRKQQPDEELEAV